MDKVYQLQNLCEILGIDLKQKVLEEVDSSIDNPSEWIAKSQALDDLMTERVNGAVGRLLQLKSQRFNQVRKMGSLILLYWTSLSTPVNDQEDLISLFHFMDLNSDDELKEPNSLSLAFIDTVEKEFNTLAQQVHDLVSRKKEKVKRLCEMTHVEYNSNTGTTDPLIALAGVRLEISRVKEQVSKRQDIVTRIIFLQRAVEEIQSQKGGGFEGDEERALKAKNLIIFFPKMLKKLEDMIAVWNANEEEPFKFDGMNALVKLETLDTHYNEAMQLEDVCRVPSPLPRFGRTAPRTPRVLVQALPPPAPNSPQQLSPPDSDKSDESMYKSDLNDADFDPDDPDDF